MECDIMRLAGEGRTIYRRILNLIEREVGSGKDRIKKLKPVSSAEKIKYFQNWLKSLPVCNERLPELNISVKPDLRTIYLSDSNCVKKLKKLGFLAESSSDNGVFVGNSFVELSCKDVEIIKSGEFMNVCRVVCPEKLVEAFLSAINNLLIFRDFLKKCGVDATSIESIISAAGKTESFFKKLRDSSMIEELVVRELSELNDRIEREIADFELTLKGMSILDIMRGDTSSLPVHEVESIIAENVIRSEEKLRKLVGVEVSGLFTLTYPVRVNERMLEKISEEIERETRIELYRICRNTADMIVENFEGFIREVNIAKDIEFSSALKRVGKSFPEIADYTAFVEGEHLFIDKPQPITYSVGSSDIADGRIVILTGANSGGKTSLLELIAQIQIMGQMGLPVRAKRAWIKIFDGVYFFKKKKIAGAGAFENAVKAFVKAVVAGGTNLIIIDEFEAITEPGAAVSIMAELLKIAYERGHYVVAVSHLGKELRKELPFARVDGIEAKGLDENFNLVVDRQPVFGKLGRSTPELIIKKMYMKSKKNERVILERILNVLKC